MKTNQSKKKEEKSWHLNEFNKDKQLFIEYEEIEQKRKKQMDSGFKDPQALEYGQKINPIFYMQNT
jgi:hypothetical protein